MPSSARRVRRSTSGPRALVASLIAILGIGIVGVIPVAAVAAAPGPGYQDWAYATGTDTTITGQSVTSDASQSKIWFNDGRWWGILFDLTGTLHPAYRIQSLDMNAQTWTSSATATRVDSRARAHPDALMSGTTLLVVSSHGGTGSPPVPPSGDLQFSKYSYSSSTKTYTLSGGIKTLAHGGTGPATITKDSLGHLWVTYTQAGGVFVVDSTDNGTTWSPAPIAIPTGVGPITANDIATIGTLTDGSTPSVGIIWSNQTVGDENFYFTVHHDGDPDTTWGARETAFAGPKGADGHISVKTDGSGQFLAAVKTSRDASGLSGNGNDPLIAVLRRDTAGTWTPHTVSTVSQKATRPILVLDGTNANVYMTNQNAGGFITVHSAPVGSLSFGPPSIGTAVIKSTVDAVINDVNSTKQTTTTQSGIIVIAQDRVTRHYMHACAGSVCPSAPSPDFTASASSGQAPLGVTFTDTSTGAPTSWLWDFGDGGTSTAQNPTHTFNMGTFDVSLTAANVAGSTKTTKAAFITVSAPPGATYVPLATPVRRLDTRSGLGLSGAFKAGVARDFQVTNNGTIPNNAVAVTGNLTVTKQTKAGYIILAPSAGSSTSTLNFPLSDTRANGVTVALSGAGKLNALYKAPAGATTAILFDVTGYFLDDNSADVYVPIAPIRRLDSRTGLGLTGPIKAGTGHDFQVTNGGTIPSTAVAVTGNLTVTKQTQAGYLILAPTAGSSTSTLNFPVGDTRANGVTVGLSGTGKLNVIYKAPVGASTAILFDVTGYFLPMGSTGARYFPIAPIRRLDSRSGLGLSGPFHAGVARDFLVANNTAIPNTAAAVTGNLTVTRQTKAGYIILAPNPGSSTSTLNFPVGDTRANGVTVQLSTLHKLDALYKASSGATTDLLFDVTGYFQ